jgi:uncharacterized protein DUF6256
VLRAILPPLVSAYAIFVAMVVLARRRPVPRRYDRGDGSALAHQRRAVGTIVGGYVAFLVIVLIFHVWLADETDAFSSAVWGGAFLSAIIAAVGSGASLTERRRRR